MSIDDVRDLGERMNEAFSTITPGPAPIDSAVHQGKTIRWRRRATALAGVAAVVAAGITVPLAVHWSASPPPPVTTHYTVTVQPPGPRSPAGLIAAGTINGKSWQIIAEKPGTQGATSGQQCFQTLGASFGSPGGSQDCGPPPTLAGDADPVQFTGSGNKTADATYGLVQSDVSYVRVTLSNGTELTLRPVTVYGKRYVGVVAPGGVIVEATAYSRHGEIASAIPFSASDGLPVFSAWLRPGQHGLPRASGRVGSQVMDGRTWPVTVYLGPWGICFDEGAGQSTCSPEGIPLGTSEMGYSSAGSQGLIIGSAAPNVARLVFALPGGKTAQALPVAVGGQRFFAVATSRDALHWTAYDAAGKVVATGP